MDAGHAFLLGVAIGLVLGLLLAVALRDPPDDGYNPFDNGWPR